VINSLAMPTLKVRCSFPAGARSRRALLVAAMLVVPAVTGCARPLLSERDQRTPFDRYDALRNQYANQYVEDEFGARQPNLRGRLAPK
jgi:hypothetical protein